MANIKSQKKRIKTNEKARIRNVSYKSKLRTAVKNVKIACATNNKSLATEKLNLAFSIIDRAVVKGIEKSATAARQKASLQKLVNAIAE
ncbi:MAG: 30S ribosomal protein S20 [Mollicutes bacterium]|nr:30S ribosomal protein S20 [Mollicutes bacterium]MDD7263898.1 30S ribosomal protein S20 [bacterium]MDY4979780.1 30S ribosomal protein S20 [Candidatus Onthovivens sp.]